MKPSHIHSLQGRRVSAWNCTEVFRQIDGRWQIIHTHWLLIDGVKV